MCIRDRLRIEDNVSTKVVAGDMPTAVSSLLDTPIKGHKPKNWAKTKLLTSTVPKITHKKSCTVISCIKRFHLIFYNHLTNNDYIQTVGVE